MQYMKAVLLARTKDVRSDGSIVEVVVWELPEPLAQSAHPYKYRLYYDHRHLGEKEEDYTFTTIGQLLDDFERDIANWRES